MELLRNKLYVDDLDVCIRHIVKIEKIRRKKILITGATGTIGSFVSDVLVRYNKISGADIKIYLAARKIDSLRKKYEAYENVIVVPYDIYKNITFAVDVDYIIHAAGNAHPSVFVSDPVGTIVGSINGTYQLLNYGREHHAERLLYLSSGEVYGSGNCDIEEFDERYAGYVDVQSPRASYPTGKRAAENLCASYSRQYGLETVVVRPCHTYGPCITSSDNRASVQFMQNVLDGRDIVMKSPGKQLRSYNYVADCVSGLITVLLNGQSGEAYNLANPECRITIRELAEKIAKIGQKDIIFENPDRIEMENMTPIERQVLSSRKIETLGWKGAFPLDVGLNHTMCILKIKE